MGSKYIFTPDKNPPPGAYDLESGLKMSQFRSQSCLIREPTSPHRRRKETSPDPGYYDGHLMKFGSGMKSTASMGSKYKFSPDKNPPLGGYDIDRGIRMVQWRNRSCVIREEVSPYRRPKEQPPDPGQYDAHLTKFGSGMRSTASMGEKHKFKPDNNPPVGGYDIERAKS